MKTLHSKLWSLPGLPIHDDWEADLVDLTETRGDNANGLIAMVRPHVRFMEPARLVEEGAVLGARRQELCRLDDRLSMVFCGVAGEVNWIRIVCQVAIDMELVVDYRGPDDELRSHIKNRLHPLEHLGESVDSAGQIILGRLYVPNPYEIVLADGSRREVASPAKPIVPLAVSGGVLLGFRNHGYLAVEQIEYRDVDLDVLGTGVRRELGRNEGASVGALEQVVSGLLTPSRARRIRASMRDEELLEYLMRDYALRTWRLTYSMLASELTILETILHANESAETPRPATDPIVIRFDLTSR